MEKWLILDLGQKISKRNLEHLLVPESKEVLKTNETKQKAEELLTGVWNRRELKELQMAKTSKI